MGSPVSPIVANLYMERFEQIALRTAPRPPNTWLRYVDDTFVILHQYDIDSFTKHINSIDPHIQFTSEEPIDDKLAFLDTKVIINEDATLRTIVYRKPTHTDQYLNFKSNHHIQHKRSVVRTLLNRINTVVSTEEDKIQEREHVTRVLRDNAYEEWMFETPRTSRNSSPQRTSKQKAGKSYPIPYIHGLSEKIGKIYRAHGVNFYYKPMNSIRNILVHPKDPTPNSKKCGVIYHIKCQDCPQHYIGETARNLGQRLKEHQRKTGTLTAVGEHIHTLNHHINPEETKVLGREDKFWRRKIHEAITIKALQPPLNRDQGYHLPPIFDDLVSCDFESHDRRA